MIYFVQAPICGLIKIGYTRREPYRRIRDLRTISPVPITILGFMVGSFRDEQRLHRQFSLSHGEWFTPTADLLEFVRENATPEPPREHAQQSATENGRKRAAVMEMLPRCKSMSNNWIAGQCGVSAAFVASVRRQTGATSSTRVTKNGKTMNVTRLGKRPQVSDLG